MYCSVYSKNQVFGVGEGCAIVGVNLRRVCRKKMWRGRLVN